MSAPGVGPIISSAMIAAIGTGDAFHRGRDFAAWLGIVPKQISTGDRIILGRISKPGNRCLRTLLIQGARAVLKNWPMHGFGAWLEAASKRLHSNVLVVALAAKLARLAWSMLAKGRDYDANFMGHAALSTKVSGDTDEREFDRRISASGILARASATVSLLVWKSNVLEFSSEAEGEVPGLAPSLGPRSNCRAPVERAEVIDESYPCFNRIDPTGLF